MTSNHSAFLNALTDVVRTNRAPVIAEIKCRDAQGQNLIGRRDPQAIARSYIDSGAAAISVVTGHWFGGDVALLASVAEVAAELPVLRKDFLVSEAALQETRDLGADAALITVALMREGQTERLIEAALRLGLTPFVEVASAAEAARVPVDLPLVIAVNNSDITTRESIGAGPTRSLALYKAVAARRPAAIVAASRIADATTAVELIGAGFDALLIGTALMRNPAMLLDIHHNLCGASVFDRAHHTTKGKSLC